MATSAAPTTPVNRDEHVEKRRRLRKGTHSCWECKRRKTKCTFASAEDNSCISCRRRGMACVGQDRVEESVTTTAVDPVQRVEALLRSLVRTSEQSPRPSQEHEAPRSTETLVAGESRALGHVFEPSPTAESSGLDTDIISGSLALLTPDSQNTPNVPANTLRNPRHRLDRAPALYAALPSNKDTKILLEACRKIALFFHQANTRSQVQLRQDGIYLGMDPIAVPSPDAHPVLQARYMLLFAALLQQLGAERIRGCLESPRVVMRRLANAARNFLATTTDLLGSMEALECLILEGIYLSNCGQLRLAWLAFRRALSVGQVMGVDMPTCQELPCLSPTTCMNPRFVWFRIVYMDCFLSLMLGLAPGTSDISMVMGADYAQDTPTGKLQRTHAVIMSRLLHRSCGLTSLPDYSETHTIDAQLLDVAKVLDDDFWLPPDFSDAEGNAEEEFWEAMRFVDHLVHYNLLNLLHLPYILRRDSEGEYTYSKMTCVGVSREILTRFITYSSFQQFGRYCQRADFFALMASTTLLLVYINSHACARVDNVLTHQRHSDRAMMSKVLYNMKRSNAATQDALSRKGINLLQCLLRIETKAASGQLYTAECVGISDSPPSSSPIDAHNMLCISIPYFGPIRISQVGVIPSENLSQQATQLAQGTASSQIDVASSDKRLELDPSQELLNRQNNAYSGGSDDPADAYGAHGQQVFDDGSGGLHDWTQDGINMEFFDCLMRGGNA